MGRLFAPLIDGLLARRGLGASLLSVALGGLICFTASISISNRWFDAMNQMWPRPNDAEQVVVVTIDEASVEAVGVWPWPRAVNARLMERIAAGNPAVVGIDIIYAEEDSLGGKHLINHKDATPEIKDWLRALETGDHELKRALEKGPFVLAVGDVGLAPREGSDPIYSFIREKGNGMRAAVHQWKEPFEPLRSHGLIRDAASGEGIVAQHKGFSGVARRTGQIFDTGGHTVTPGLVLEMLRVATGSNSATIQSDDTGIAHIVFRAGREDILFLETEKDGALRPWFSYRNKALEIPAISLMSNDDDLAELEGKFVLVGYAAGGGLDERVSPLGELVPGVEAHRQTLESIIQVLLLNRPYWARQAEYAAAFALVLLVAFGVPRMRLSWGATVIAGAIGAPLAAAMLAYILGRLVFDAAMPAMAVAVAGGLSFFATMALSERERRRADAARQRLDGEMAAAKRIQMGILPNAAEVFPDEARFSIAAISEPARTVGGDLYDFFLLDDKRLFFLVGDVSGKGPEASLFMAISKVLCKSAALRNMASIGNILEQANAEISRDNPGVMFVTAFAGILNVESGALEYCAAGHEAPWLIHRDGTEIRLEGEGGPPLCLLDEFPFPSDHTQLLPGDVLVVVTDGVTEAQNAAGELFGVERTDQALSGVAGATDAADVLAQMTAPITEFVGDAEPADDLTAIVIIWPGPVGKAETAA